MPGFDPNDLRITTKLNGVKVQDANRRDCLFGVAELVAFLSEGTTLAPGTVILTGTPAGVGYVKDPPRWLKEGDVVEVEVEGCGVLRNTVEDEGVGVKGDGKVWSHALERMIDP